MKLRSGMSLAIGASLVLGGCAAATTGAGTAALECAEGVPTSVSRLARQAKESVDRATVFAGTPQAETLYQQAATQAQQAVEAEPENPWGHVFLGAARAGSAQYEGADQAFDRAEQICAAVAAETEEYRERAWEQAFNAGIEAYNAGNTEQAATLWSQANAVFDRRPEAFMNLAIIHTQNSSYEEAIQAYRQGIAAADRQLTYRQLAPEEVEARQKSRAEMAQNLADLLIYTEQFAEAEKLYREQLQNAPNDVQIQSNLALAIARQGREAEAAEIYQRLLANTDLTGTDLFNIGVALFNAKNYPQSAEAFRRVTEMMPNSRDAWYNLANTLYAANEFTRLVPVAERLAQLDPLNENSALILARAYRETQQNQKALRELQRNEELPVRVEDLALRTGEERTTVRGRVVGNRATAGSPVQLRFTFYGDAGELGAETVTVTAPAKDQNANFEVVFPQVASGYKYELVR